ncbi:MAG: hypothetical protein R8K48_01855 [Gallionella sp.]
MRNKDVMTVIRCAFLGALILSLSACINKPFGVFKPLVKNSSKHSDVVEKKSVKTQVTETNNTSEVHQLIIPRSTVEKNKFLVSYNVKALQRQVGYLIKLSLIFRNMKDQSVKVRPRVRLLNNVGQPMVVYSKNNFIKYSNHLTGKASVTLTNMLLKTHTSLHSLVKERRNWAKFYWLKRRFTMPSKGIELGELVYHSPGIKLPMTLIVKSAGQEFKFTINTPISVEGAKQALK